MCHLYFFYIDIVVYCTSQVKIGMLPTLINQFLHYHSSNILYTYQVYALIGLILGPSFYQFTKFCPHLRLSIKQMVSVLTRSIKLLVSASLTGRPDICVPYFYRNIIFLRITIKTFKTTNRSTGHTSVFIITIFCQRIIVGLDIFLVRFIFDYMVFQQGQMGRKIYCILSTLFVSAYLLAMLSQPNH